jgi:hypothetical protein
VELPPLIFDVSPSPEWLLTLLIITVPPPALLEDEPAEILIDPPRPFSVDVERPTSNEMSPPLPWSIPPVPVVRAIDPESPAEDAPVNIATSPNIPTLPALHVCSKRSPELVSSTIIFLIK